MSTEKIISDTLRREGWPKYTNLAADRGGPTKGGITLGSWREFKQDQTLTAADLQAVTEQEARRFYFKRYIADPKFDQIANEALQELLVDAGVHHGPKRPSKWLQAALGVRRDGVLGPVTLAAADKANAQSLFLLIIAKRIRLFGRLVSADKALSRAKRDGYQLQAIFAAGWNNRAAEFIEQEARRQ